MNSNSSIAIESNKIIDTENQDSIFDEADNSQQKPISNQEPSQIESLINNNKESIKVISNS